MKSVKRLQAVRDDEDGYKRNPPGSPRLWIRTFYSVGNYHGTTTDLSRTRLGKGSLADPCLLKMWNRHDRLWTQSPTSPVHEKSILDHGKVTHTTPLLSISPFNTSAFTTQPNLQPLKPPQHPPPQAATTASPSHRPTQPLPPPPPFGSPSYNSTNPWTTTAPALAEWYSQTSPTYTHYLTTLYPISHCPLATDPCLAIPAYQDHDEIWRRRLYGGSRLRRWV